MAPILSTGSGKSHVACKLEKVRAILFSSLMMPYVQISFAGWSTTIISYLSNMYEYDLKTTISISLFVHLLTTRILPLSPHHVPNSSPHRDMNASVKTYSATVESARISPAASYVKTKSPSLTDATLTPNNGSTG